MSNARQLAAYPKDGTEVLWRGAAQYDTAGLVMHENGQWSQVHHGFSHQAVAKRTKTHYLRFAGIVDWEVVPIWETTAPILREYFGHHRVWVQRAFTPREGWQCRTGKASRSMLRKLAQEGVTAVEVTEIGVRTADFQMTEITASLHGKKVSR